VPGQEQVAEALAGDILRICLRYGGSITGEHGVGVEKQEEIDLMYNADELSVMFAIKQALDADDLCNPRKVFPVRLFPAADPAFRARPA
jgi:glycolate oxidase